MVLCLVTRYVNCMRKDEEKMLVEEQKSRTQVFVDEYRRLERIIRNKYGITDYSI